MESICRVEGGQGSCRGPWEHGPYRGLFCPYNPPPAEFSTYLNFCRSLRFDDKPDYSYLRQLFRNLFHRQGFSYDYVFDWNMLKFVSHLEAEAGLGDWMGKALTQKDRVALWWAGLLKTESYELDCARDHTGVPEPLCRPYSCFTIADSTHRYGQPGPGRVPPPTRPRRPLLGARGRAWMALAGPAAVLIVAYTFLLLLFCTSQAAAFTVVPLASMDPFGVLSFFLVTGPWPLLGGCSFSLF